MPLVEPERATRNIDTMKTIVYKTIMRGCENTIKFLIAYKAKHDEHNATYHMSTITRIMFADICYACDIIPLPPPKPSP